MANKLLDPQQLSRRTPQHRHPLCIAQRRRVEDVIHRFILPRKWVVGAHHNLPGADLRSQVAQRFSAENRVYSA